jgi:thiamine-phosphate pyrophosphorylase
LRRLSPGAAPQDSLSALLAAISAAAAGIHWIQLREKDLSAKHCSWLLRAALTACAPGQTSPRIFMNDRLDVAVVEHAAGVHLGENSLPVPEARRLLKNLSGAPASRHSLAEFSLGVSCHSLASAKAAAAAGADYLFFGPVFPTPSKAAYGPAQGLTRLAEVCRAVSIPVLAIGGITLENASYCLHSGASGIAAIRLFQDAHELPAVLHRLASLR